MQGGPWRLSGVCLMKDLQSILKLLVVGLVAAVALALVLTGREAARGFNERELLAQPRTLHQMVLEAEAADRPDRSNTLLFGAGLLALAGLAFGAFLLAMNGGTAFLRERRLGRKKKSHRSQPAYSPYPTPTIEGPAAADNAPRIAPTAPAAPLLGDGGDNRLPTHR